VTPDLRRLAAHPRTRAELIGGLAEFERRSLHAHLGSPSLFAYCTGTLGLPDQDALQLIEAARHVRRLPLLLEKLRAGSLTPATVRLLAPHLTGENHVAVVEAAEWRSRQQVIALVARLFPSGRVTRPVRRPNTVLPREERERLAASSPGGRPVVTRGVTARLQTGRSRASSSRPIPTDVRRAVDRRDGRRCAFVSPDGRRCEVMRSLEFHHVVPFGAGQATVDVVQLRCGAHSGYGAETG